MALRVVEQAFLSDTGRQRAANEDAYFVRSPNFVVADGMGGAQAGEVASRVAVEAFRAASARTETNPEAYLRRVVLVANNAIHELARRDSSRSGMGTTITAALAEEDSISFAHVGDSRAYRLRGGTLSQLTRDHSLVEELRRRGRLTEDEAAEHPQRSIITRALGPEPQVEVDTVSYAVEDGDIYLLCSDGLTSMVRDERLAAILAAGASLEETARRLVVAANAAGGRDNITVVLFRIAEAGDRPVPDLEPTEAIGPPLPQLPVDDTTVESPAAVPAAAAAGGANAAANRAEAADTAGSDTSAADGNGDDRNVDGEGKTQGREKRKGRRIFVIVTTVVVLALLISASVWAVRQVYFLGGDDNDNLALFRGLPYELPLGISLYGEVETTGVAITRLPASRRPVAVDHQLRSEADARSLLSDLEDEAHSPNRNR